MSAEGFTCPVCGMYSTHPIDVREGYCGGCHAFTGAPRGAERSFPGPESIEPGQNPGALVIHIYAVPTSRLLLISRPTIEDVRVSAEQGADIALDVLKPDETGFCLVAFDGDSGERLHLG